MATRDVTAAAITNAITQRMGAQEEDPEVTAIKDYLAGESTRETISTLSSALEIASEEQDVSPTGPSEVDKMLKDILEEPVPFRTDVTVGGGISQSLARGKQRGLLARQQIANQPQPSPITGPIDPSTMQRAVLKHAAELYAEVQRRIEKAALAADLPRITPETERV